VKSKTYKGPMPSRRRPSTVFLWSGITMQTSAIEPRNGLDSFCMAVMFGLVLIDVERNGIVVRDSDECMSP